MDDILTLLVNCPACLRKNKLIMLRPNPVCGACGSSLKKVALEALKRKQNPISDLLGDLFGFGTGKF